MSLLKKLSRIWKAKKKEAEHDKNEHPPEKRALTSENTIDKISQNIGILQTNFLNAMAELEISEVKKRVSLFDMWIAVGLVILILTMIF